MNIVKGSTTNESKMIKGVQSAVGALVDGEIGTQTMSDIACTVKADCFPLTLEIYNMPVIIAGNIVPIASQGKKVTYYSNCMSGSFLSGTTPWSVLVRDGITIRGHACHYDEGYPESVLYRYKNGEFGIKRVKSVVDIPNNTNLRWAVGGLGLLGNYSPTAEGFTGRFSDVLRKTNHTMLGQKNNYCYLVYCKNMTASEVNAFAKKLGLEMAVMLDGGHVAAINGSESFAKINTSQAQYYMIQGEK